jgi:hypothetical protein
MPDLLGRLLTRLTLRKEGDLYFIAMQEDFYHPDVSCVSASLIPTVTFYIPTELWGPAISSTDAFHSNVFTNGWIHVVVIC